MLVKIEHILFIVIGGVLLGLLVSVILIAKPQIQQPETAKVDLKTEPFMAKLQRIENDIQSLFQKEENQATLVADLKKQIEDSKSSKLLKGKTVLSVASTQGGVFTTASQTYSPMGMYANVNCPVACYLWLNFYSSSKNQTQPPGAPGYLNTYNAFIDGSDKNIFSQASFPSGGSAGSVSLNAAVAVSSGFHTVDVRAKTNGGTLESTASYLQVMAVEQ